VLSRYKKKYGNLDRVKEIVVGEEKKGATVSAPPRLASPLALPAPAPITRAATPPAGPTGEEKPIAEDFKFVVRQNFADVWLFDSRTLDNKKFSVLDAHGASIAYTRDQIANNTLWSVHGMGAAVWSVYYDYTRDDSTKILGIS